MSSENNQDELISKQKAAIDEAIKKTYKLIGDLEDLSALKTELSHDAVFAAKAASLRSSFSAIRRTRPDGNCFFRAFAFSYFERLLNDEAEYDRFCKVIAPTKDTMVRLGFPAFTVEDFYDNFVEQVERFNPRGCSNADGETTRNGLKVLVDTFNDQGMSDYIVVFLRLLTSMQIREEADFYQNFMEGGRSVADFCALEVEPMYHESDNIHIQAMVKTTGISVRIMYLDRGNNKEASVHDFPELDSGNQPLVHLLYRPGHYDIIYPNETDK